MLERRKEKEDLLGKSKQIHEWKSERRMEYRSGRLLLKEAGIHHFKRRQGGTRRYRAGECVALVVTGVGVLKIEAC